MYAIFNTEIYLLHYVHYILINPSIYLCSNMPYLLKPMILIIQSSIDSQVCGIDFIATP